MTTAAPPTAPIFYITDGTLPPDAASYVERACSLATLVALDRDLLEALRAGDYCYVLNPLAELGRELGLCAVGAPTD
jgi:hypothetical protein